MYENEDYRTKNQRFFAAPGGKVQDGGILFAYQTYAQQCWAKFAPKISLVAFCLSTQWFEC